MSSIINQGRTNVILPIVTIATTFFIALLAEVKFDFTVLGYFLLVLSSPILVLLASDLRKMKRA